MKLILNKITVLMLLFSLSIFIACEKAVSEEEVGIENVFIPQSFSNGTSSNDYNIPGSLNFGDARNFKDDAANNKVNVFLGVAKSGKASTKSFTVDVTSRPDTINRLITNGAGFVLLPSSAYTLPAKVSLNDGQSAFSFNLSIDRTILKTYAGKKVAACIALSNPSKYTLNSKAKNVIVIIDVNALALK